MTYKSKIPVEAFRFSPDWEADAPQWFGRMVDRDLAHIDRILEDGAIRTYGCTIFLSSGRLQAKVGDYIIRSPGGAYQVLTEEQFHKQYEEYRR